MKINIQPMKAMLPLCVLSSVKRLVAFFLCNFSVALGVVLYLTLFFDVSEHWEPVRSNAASWAQLERDFLDQAYDPAAVIIAREDWVREMMVHQSTMSEAEALKISEKLSQESRKLGYDPLFFLAMIAVESEFKPKALSERGAMGLMQLMPKTREWLLSRDKSLKFELSVGVLSEEEANVQLGMRYFAYLHRSFRNLDRALGAYNFGPGRLLQIESEQIINNSEIKEETPDFLIASSENTDEESDKNTEKDDGNILNDLNKTPQPVLPTDNLISKKEQAQKYAEKVIKKYQHLKQQYAHLSL